MLAVGLVLRTLAQPMPSTEPARAVALVASGLLELGGVALAVSAFARLIRSGVQPGTSGVRLVLPLTMASSLFSALILNLVACAGLAGGAAVVPFGLNEALLHLALWGFAATMVLAVAGRVFPRFLLLQPTRERLVPYALGLWAVGNLGLAVVWLVTDGAAVPRPTAALLQLTGAFLYVLALRLYDAPVRPSGTPRVTEPTRRWARVAFALMLMAAAANVGLASAEAFGRPATLTSLSAARHALAQGFLLPVIVVMAARILPGYSGYMLPRARRLAGLVWLLLAGAGLRFVAEFVGGYMPGWGALAALGGSLSVLAFAIFAVDLWRTTGRAPMPGAR